MDRRVASFTGSDGVADQLECQVLEVVLVVRELLENFFRVAFSGKNVAVVGAGHQEVVENSTPPLLRSVLEHVVADHLVKKIDSLHVLLVVGETLWRVDVLAISLRGTALHLTNIGWIVEVGEGQHWLRIPPDGAGEIIELGELEFVSVETNILRQQLCWQTPSICTNCATGIDTSDQEIAEKGW